MNEAQPQPEQSEWRKSLRPLKFNFGGTEKDDPIHDGFTDDSDWNGFVNVWVTPETRAKLVEQLIKDDPHGNFIEDRQQLEAIPVEDGLVSLAGGYATVERPRPHQLPIRKADREYLTKSSIINEFITALYGPLGKKDEAYECIKSAVDTALQFLADHQDTEEGERFWNDIAKSEAEAEARRED